MILPVRVEFYYEREPLVNYGLIVLMILVWLAGFFLPVGDLALTRENPAGLLSAPLAHTGIPGLLSSCLILWVFGSALNANLGHVRYLLLFLFLALVSGLSHLCFFTEPLSGAEGPVSGIVGCFIFAYPRAQVDTISYWGLVPRRIQVSAWGLALVWFLFDLGGMIVGSSQSSYAAGAAGLVSGLLAGWILVRAGILIHFEKSARFQRDFKK